MELMIVLIERPNSKNCLSVKCPMVFSFSIPQDCFSRIPLLAHDPDGDHVKCSFAPNATVPLNVSLDEVSLTPTSLFECENRVYHLDSKKIVLI